MEDMTQAAAKSRFSSSSGIHRLPGSSRPRQEHPGFRGLGWPQAWCWPLLTASFRELTWMQPGQQAWSHNGVCSASSSPLAAHETTVYCALFCARPGSGATRLLRLNSFNSLPTWRGRRD